MTDLPDAQDPGTEPRTEALADALRHVLADAICVTALAQFARWNTARTAAGPQRALFLRRTRAGRGAQEALARRLRAIGRPAALHPSDPSEVPRWMLAAQSDDPLAQTALLAAAGAEFLASVEAAIEVARDAPDPPAMRGLGRLARRERAALAEMRTFAEAALAARAREPGPTRH